MVQLLKYLQCRVFNPLLIHCTEGERKEHLEHVEIFIHYDVLEKIRRAISVNTFSRIQ